MKRALLARSSTIATRQRVYRIPDGLEVDDVDHYEVRRSRVLYEDVILVTYHRHRGVLFVAIVSLFAVLSTAMSWGIGRNEPMAGWIVFSLTTVPLLLVVLLRLGFGVDELNVYSRRSQARLRFVFRKGRARKLMDEITAEVRRRQRSMQGGVAGSQPARTS